MNESRDIDRHNAEVRKITVGTDPKNGLTYEVGSKANKEQYTISHIGLSEYDNAVYNKRVYQVFITVNGRKSRTEHIWKDFDGVPCSTEYKIPDED